MEAREFLLDCFKKQGDYDFLPGGVFLEMLDCLIELDEAFMARTGVGDGALYDDEQAEEELFAALSERFPEYKMYMLRLVNDYLDYNEEYLESVDGIEWE